MCRQRQIGSSFTIHLPLFHLCVMLLVLVACITSAKLAQAQAIDLVPPNNSELREQRFFIQRNHGGSFFGSTRAAILGSSCRTCKQRSDYQISHQGWGGCRAVSWASPNRGNCSVLVEIDDGPFFTTGQCRIKIYDKADSRCCDDIPTPNCIEGYTCCPNGTWRCNRGSGIPDCD